ncbi:MAG: DUF1343 domain-containing protein, partial [Proteobacteria bacterium]|nr:DUF1343 domain-containing protein [Pseudomonadota bacterium]
DWLDNVFIRPCYFETTFHKHQGQMSAGLQFHTGYPGYHHDGFKPYRLVAGLLKSLRLLLPEYELWRYHEYEYELDRVPIDVINGGPALRDWVDGNEGFEAMSARLEEAEQRWREARQASLIYQP